MADRRGWSRRQLLAGTPLLAVGTAGCMRFASEDASARPFEPSIDAVDAPAETRLHDDVALRLRLAGDGDRVGDATVAVAVDDRRVAEESVRLDPEADRSLETEIGFTPTEPGERELTVVVTANGDDEPADRWTDTLVVTGRQLAFEWGDTFVPADHAESASDTRRLAFACFLLQLRRNGDVIAEYEVGADAAFEFVRGAYPPESIADDRLETFDGDTGRWLGTEDERTVLAVPDATLLERAETLELYGYSLFERETTVRVRDGDTTIDTARVPTRDAGESAIEIDLRDYDAGS